jgi:hypothetical protein
MTLPAAAVVALRYRFQKAPVNPTLSKIARASSAVGLRKFRSSRVPYHRCERSQAWAGVISAPRATACDAHQRSTSSSDRKSRMFAHVYAMSSQKCEAGTSKWITPLP